MAFDVITGKQFTPKFEGQRTAATLADETEIDKYITEMWGKGAAPTQGFGALQSVYEANEGFRPDITFPDGTFQQGVAGSPVTRDVWYVNNQRMTEAGLAQKIADARAQLMGGGEGNPFLRTEAGLDAWRPMNMNLPQSSYYQGLDDTARAALNFDSETGFYAGGVPQINAATATAPTATTMGAPAAAPAAAPASTRQTTSVTQPDAAAAAAAEVDPAIAQREIIEKALAAKLKPIQNALAAGLLDVGTAQAAWDSARSEIYGDFLTEQTGVQQGFQTQQEADEAKRLAGRTKLLQDLNAAGVDSGMVADELALIDAIAEGSGQERMGLIGDMGRIGLMSDADRRMMGEGIFGGYEQDLRSQARQATLAAELDAAGQIQTAEERALSAGRLSDYMGIPVEALMADLYSDIDLTGMATGREEMDWGTSERLGSQEWQTGEREGAQTWQTGEREGAQTWQTGERTGAQTWQGDENVLDRVINQQLADVSTDQLAEQIRQFGITTPTTTGADGVERMVGFDEATGLTAAQTQDQANWLANMIAQGIDMDGTGRAYGFDTATGLTAGQTATFASQGIDPATGRPYGFDTATGLTAGQTQDQSNWLANMIASGIDMSPGGTGMAYGFDPLTGLTAGQRQQGDQFTAGQVAQGIDMRQTIQQPDPLTGYMREVPNPNYGRPLGFNEQTGLTAGQTQDQLNWDALFTQGEDQFTTGQENWQALFDQGADEFAAGQLAQGVDTRQTILQTDPQTGYMRTVPNPNYGRPMGFDATTGLTAGQTADQTYRDAMLAADETAAATQGEQWQSSFDASQLGMDTQRWVQDDDGKMIENPTYGMSPAQQADYAMDLWTMTQAGAGESDATSNLMNHLATLGDPVFTSAALTEIHRVINTSETLVSKGLSENNILYALGSLSNTQGEPDAQGNPTYPYRDMFLAVQQGATTPPDDDSSPPYQPPGSIGTEDEGMVAVADAAAAAGGGGATFIPGGGEFGYDTVVAPVPAGTQPHNASQQEYHYETGTPIAFYLNDGRPIYQDSEGMYLMYPKSGETIRFYKGDGWRWPADQEWPPPIVQHP